MGAENGESEVVCGFFHILCEFIFFFFSSRRRHTRSDRDWSSDVCSSDLDQAAIGIGAGQMSRLDASFLAIHKARQQGHDPAGAVLASDAFFPFADGVERSEERRVGKECRSRWSPYH